MIALPVIFNPTPEAAAAILADLDDPSLSFDALAKKHGTTTEALALWLSTDPVKDQIQTTLDAMALRVRRLATSRLPAAVAAISRIVDSSGDLRRRDHFEQSSVDPASPAYLADLERRRRRDESTRRACHLLLRLANFFSPLKPPSPRSPGRGPEALRGGEGSEISPSVVGRRGDLSEPCASNGTGTGTREGTVASERSSPNGAATQSNGSATIRERTSEVGRRDDLTQPCASQFKGAAMRISSSAPSATSALDSARPSAPYSAGKPLPTAHSPLPSAQCPVPSAFCLPSLSIYDLLPKPPPINFGPRAPGRVRALAGTCGPAP